MKRRIVAHLSALRPFRAVIEASASYRWLYDRLTPLGEVILAHPLRLRASIARPAKTDKLDAALLAQLLRMDQIPESYVPPTAYQELRELTRARARLSRSATEAKNQLHGLLAARNIHRAYRRPFGVRGRRWMRSLDLGVVGNLERDELIGRLEHYDQEQAHLDRFIAGEWRMSFRRSRRSADIRGIGTVHSAAGRRGDWSAGAVQRAGPGFLVCRAGCASGSVRRARLPWAHHAAGIALAALGAGAGGDQGHRPRPQAGEFLRARAKTIQPAHRTSGRGAKAGGDLLDPAAALASRARRGVERKNSCALAAFEARSRGLASGPAKAGRMRRYCDWADAARRESCTVRGRNSETVRMGV